MRPRCAHLWEVPERQNPPARLSVPLGFAGRSSFETDKKYVFRDKILSQSRLCCTDRTSSASFNVQVEASKSPRLGYWLNERRASFLRRGHYRPNPQVPHSADACRVFFIALHAALEYDQGQTRALAGNRA